MVIQVSRHHKHTDSKVKMLGDTSAALKNVYENGSQNTTETTKN